MIDLQDLQELFSCRQKKAVPTRYVAHYYPKEREQFTRSIVCAILGAVGVMVVAIALIKSPIAEALRSERAFAVENGIGVSEGDYSSVVGRLHFASAISLSAEPLTTNMGYVDFDEFTFGNTSVPEMVDYQEAINSKARSEMEAKNDLISEPVAGEPMVHDEDSEFEAVEAAPLETQELNLAPSNDPDMSVRSNVTAEQLSSGLLYVLADHAQAFVDAEEKYGVNAVALASIAAYESGWGRYQIAPNNIFGWRKGNGDYVEFSSIEESVDTVAMYLSQNYLAEGGKYHNGTLVSSVNRRYNGRQCWQENVSAIYSQIAREIVE